MQQSDLAFLIDALHTRGILTSRASDTGLKAEEIRMEATSQDSLDGSRVVATQQDETQFGYLCFGTLTLSLIVQEEPGALVTPPKTSAAGIFTFEDNQKGDFVLDVAPEPTKKNNKAVKAGKMTLEELQVEYMKLCKKKRALDSKFQVLQELCSKLRQENDALKVEASYKGKLSATVFLLEMEIKSLKASLTSESTQSLQKLLTATEKNAAVRVKELNRKAEVTLVRGYWMQQEAAVKKDSKEALTAAESQHSAELALASTREKTVPDQATNFENYQPVAVPVWATANSDDKGSTCVVDSYTNSMLFSSPWDATAAAAELDASECDEVDYELLWTKGPQYWYGNDDDDWGIDDE
ncbi:hypothetical protein WJX82_000718 [Trebouxia sp. C0006]